MSGRAMSATGVASRSTWPWLGLCKRGMRLNKQEQQRDHDGDKESPDGGKESPDGDKESPDGGKP